MGCATGCDFDWYKAGVSDSPDYILCHLMGGFEMSSVVSSRPRHGYAEAADVVIGDRRLCSVQWGGNTGDRVMVESSGFEAPRLASLVRSEWPQHHLLRADVAIDIDLPDAWESLSSMALNLADKYDLKTRHVGDYHRAKEGRSIYVGSRQSSVMLRVYEKGIEQRVKGISDGASVDLVRVETEIKPKKSVARMHCATLSPSELLGCAPFTTEMAKILLDESVERVVGLNRLKRPSDRDRALAAMVKQYGKHLDSLRSDEGSWAAVGDALGRMFEGSKGR